jgi:hypothetical protein
MKKLYIQMVGLLFILEQFFWRHKLIPIVQFNLILMLVIWVTLKFLLKLVAFESDFNQFSILTLYLEFSYLVLQHLVFINFILCL